MHSRVVLSCIASIVGAIRLANAQVAGPSSDAAAALSLQPAYDPSQGINAGGFLLYPTLFVGGIYNSNVYSTSSNPKGALGVVITPALNGIDDQGLHKTSFYFNATADLYPGLSSTSGSSTLGQAYPNNIVGAVGIDHTWRPAPDVIVDGSVSYSRQDSLFGPVNTNNLSFVSTSTTVNVTPFQQTSNTAAANLSVEKEFGSGFFLRGGLGVQDLGYEPPPSGYSSTLSSLTYTGFLRAGYRITPQVVAFVEVDDNIIQYTNNWYNSNSYRVIGGLSSDLIGLFRGEVFAGFQEQYSLNDNFGSTSAPAFGASLYYYPTRYLTLGATVNDAFGSAAVENGVTPGSPSSTTVEGRFQVQYKMFEYWSANAFAGYGQTDYSNSSQRDATWTLGAGLSYDFWRNVGVAVNYQYLATNSNVASTPGYSQNMVTAGLTYRY
jgi:hypothetical protein